MTARKVSSREDLTVHTYLGRDHYIRVAPRRAVYKREDGTEYVMEGKREVKINRVVSGKPFFLSVCTVPDCGGD